MSSSRPRGPSRVRRSPAASRRASASRAATRWRSGRSPRASRSSSSARSSASPRSRHRAGRLGPRAQCRLPRLRARLRLRAGAPSREFVLPVEQQATFEGFRRANGKAGTRNYVGILTSVNCSASRRALHGRGGQALRPARRLSRMSTASSRSTHGTGCGIDYNGESFEVLKRTHWGYARNPNMAAC